MKLFFFSSISGFFKRFFATCQDYWYVPPQQAPEAPQPVKKASTKRSPKTGTKRPAGGRKAK